MELKIFNVYLIPHLGSLAKLGSMKTIIKSSLILVGVWVGYKLINFGSFGQAQAASRPVTETANPVASPVETNPGLFVELSQKAVPSVVNVFTFNVPRAGDMNGIGPEEFFRHFFNDEMGSNRGMQIPHGANPSQAARPRALGTGFVINDRGYILTNNHVIAGADEVKVKFTEDEGEKPINAKVIGRDPELDVAILKPEKATQVKPLPFGDSDSLKVGEYVMAVGNPFGQGHSVTHGIISAKGRISPMAPLAGWLQTDAPINPGNSGGPLLNLKGEVIGINNAIDARGQGIGFAIPINAVKKILAQLENGVKIERGFLGLQVAPPSPELKGQLGLPKDLEAPIVTQAMPSTPAFKAGVRAFDAIVEVDGNKIHSPGELIAVISSKASGNTVKLKINREGTEKTLDVKLGSRPTAETEG